MSVQTLVITNRCVKRARNKGNSLFGEEFNKDQVFRIASADALPLFVMKKVKHPGGRGFRYRKGVTKKPYSLNLLEKDQEQAYLQNMLSQYDNGKPWLFFIHGNNQTFAKNLIKSRKIQDKYDVNMLIFSWPSRSFDDNMELYFLRALIQAIFKKGWSSLMSVKKGIEKKIQQYKTASTYAGLAVDSFIPAFSFIRDHFLIPAKAQHPDISSHLLVHSLGHKILKLASQRGELTGIQFDKVLLHHADELNLGHREWVKELAISTTDNTNIVINQKDATLFLSDMLQNVAPESGKINLKVAKALARYAKCLYREGYIDDIHRTRIGNHLDDGDSPVVILDVSGREGIGTTHESAWSEDTGDDTINEIRQLLS